LPDSFCPAFLYSFTAFPSCQEKKPVTGKEIGQDFLPSGSKKVLWFFLSSKERPGGEGTGKGGPVLVRPGAVWQGVF
jgi:hypothetical protein